MLGWIYIWKGEVGTKVKVRFGNLWFHLLVLSTTPLDYGSILRDKTIYKSICSRQERWKELGEPDFSDYRDLDLYELSRIIFLGAPEDERKERETEWEGLRSYYRRKLPMSVDLNVYWYPNRFDILFPSIDLTIDFWRRLPRRDHKRKPKNIVKWFDSATETKDPGNYIIITQPLGTFQVNLAALIWWLGDARAEVLLEEMFGEILLP